MPSRGDLPRPKSSPTLDVRDLAGWASRPIRSLFQRDPEAIPKFSFLKLSQMSTLLSRFLRYVKIDTQSNETSSSVPSTTKQLDLSRQLEAECRQLGLVDVTLDQFGIVMATVPSTCADDAPTIAWVAHVDTSPETSGTGVKPIVHSPYTGGDIVLPGDPSKIIRVA